MLASDIISATSIDVRQVLGSSGGDANIILGWVDRVHKDCLHSSIFSYLNRQTTSVTTVAGTASYTLSLSGIRRISDVFDRTFNWPLLPYDQGIAPQTGSEPGTPEGPGAQEQPEVLPQRLLTNRKFAGPFMQYFRLVGTNQLVVYPAPPSTVYASTLEITVENQVADITSTSQTLVIPGDGKDMMVAGVNELVMNYLFRGTEAQAWGQKYQLLKAGVTIS